MLFEAACHALRGDEVVSVHKGDVFPPGFLKPPVAGSPAAPVGLLKDPHPGVLLRPGFHQGKAPVFGPVVHQDKLHLLRHTKGGGYRGVQGFFGVINGNDHG